MLIDSQLTKQWLDEWLDSNSIADIHKYNIKVQIVDYVPDRLQISLKYCDQVIYMPEAKEAIVKERNLAGIKNAVLVYLQDNKQTISNKIKWINFVKSLEHINEFREKDSPA